METSFEKALTDLEEIVARLESGDLPLEESLKLFEKGISLSRTCRDRLASAERRIEILTKQADGTLDASEVDPDSLKG